MKKIKTGKDTYAVTKERKEKASLLGEKEKKLRKAVLITGNANKLAEFQQILKDKVELESKNIDLEEFQGECEEIASKKAIQAFNKTKRQAVIVEDTSLCFNALGGLPGPYIKWFLESLKHEGLNKMIGKFDDKTAYAQCIIAYMDRSLKQPLLFVGRTNGKIVMPRGDNNFGWDPIFEPEGFTQTYAEMDKEQKNKISHRYRAIEKLLEHFEDKPKETIENNHEKKENKMEQEPEKPVETNDKPADQLQEKPSEIVAEKENNENK